jgi:hypothetical protein
MDIQYNTKCYTFEKKTYPHGFLDKCVDATYIIHLKNNGREQHIEEQLSQFQPTQTVYIVHNEGFKKCDKKLLEQVSHQDLTDAFLQCFQHADENAHNHILILEDDFLFSPEIKNSHHLDTIHSFILSKNNEAFLYYLGCIPLVIVPYDTSHYSSFKSFTTHSIIYSKQARSAFIDLQNKHWDIIVEKNIFNRYLYYKPLCYQLFPETENKQNWKDKDGMIMTELKSFLIPFLKLDKEAEWGFSCLYGFSKFLFCFFLFLSGFLLYFTIQSTSVRKKLQKLQKLQKYVK